MTVAPPSDKCVHCRLVSQRNVLISDDWSTEELNHSVECQNQAGRRVRCGWEVKLSQRGNKSLTSFKSLFSFLLVTLVTQKPKYLPSKYGKLMSQCPQILSQLSLIFQLLECQLLTCWLDQSLFWDFYFKLSYEAEINFSLHYDTDLYKLTQCCGVSCSNWKN